MPPQARRLRLGIQEGVVDRRDDGAAGEPGIRGVMFAMLQEVDHPDQIRVEPGGRIIGLRPGLTCNYPVGTRVCVDYVIRDGRYEAERISVGRLHHVRF
jgi:hypothetical protein